MLLLGVKFLHFSLMIAHWDMCSYIYDPLTYFNFLFIQVSTSFPVIIVVEHFAVSEAERLAEKVIEQNCS